MKKTLMIIGVFAALALSACGYGSPAEEKGPMVVLHTQGGNKEISVELADTSAERTQGLMFRKSMPREDGMFFVFDDEDTRNFWMKNTLIPLDMVFFGPDYKVLNIAKNVQPCRKDPCEVYSSTGPAKYVLEVNGGVSDELELKPGDRAELKI
jgi:uncharacterized membrane protein (UPF0127 family)